MANPRKFSEKIALHNHRQAEETAAFEKIMKEVNEVTTQDEIPLANRAPAYRVDSRSRPRSQGGPIRRPHDRRLDTSPYSSGTYLSPPTDTGWRRTNSDSALHQTTMQGMVDRNNDGSNRGWNIPIMNGPDRHLDGRPKSSCDIPSRVPGISIHTSIHDSSMIQIPIGNNTGSLPDLTNVDFSSPIHAPLDQDHDSSPYSSSPVNTSPSTLSPTSIPQGVRPSGRFQFTPVSHAHSNIPLDKNVVNLVDGTEFTQLQGMTGMYQQQCPPTSPSPTLQQTAGYRSPRPSPQSSPSPGDCHSAPCSPGAPSPLPNNYNIFNQHQVNFQQHFEQLSMMDNPPNTMYADQSPNAQQMTQSHPPPTLPEVSSMGNMEMTPDAGYYSTSPSQQMYPSTSPGLHTTQNSTGLPEIILTDFSVDGDVSRQDSLRQLESEFFSDETLREGLGQLDFDEFQILSNPNIGISEIVEDRLRLDHRS
ncbi:CREB-regulated transcription coactivator 1 isoform X2 [Anoplophora glabripennis]|uniref:CREB-regulated transcription coactivator 1 isoform X2 n=1 Tax=Anoplophora glabripennis TaxID=217634 RepID=UPI000875773D|nr:CREB-regulated transcription coactivator 1 isoform X2 [Anoplophora glabripennis]